MNIIDNNIIIDDIGKLIEIAMTDKNFTQKDLANKMGVKQQMISQWINGSSS